MLGLFRSLARAALGVFVGALCLGSCTGGDDRDDGGAGESGAHAGVGGSGGRQGRAGENGQAGTSDSGASGGEAGSAGSVAGSSGAGGAGGGMTLAAEDVQELDEGGGVLEAGNAMLVVPPGALAETTRLTLRHFASSTNVLDDVYEMQPDGLVFLAPARFILSLGADVVAERPEAAGRVLAYVDDPALPRPLPSNARFVPTGSYAGAVRHFSHVGAASFAEPVKSPHFAEFENASTYPVSGKCSELQSQFLSTDGGKFASETNVMCDGSSQGKVVIATPKDGMICVSVVIPADAQTSTSLVQYPSWGDVSEKCEADWDDFLKRLADHERLHQEIGEAGCRTAYEDLGSPPTACAKTERAATKKAAAMFVQALSEAMDPVGAMQDSIDVGDGHGVIMNCDCECEDPCEHMDPAKNKCVPIECAGECEKCVDGECRADTCDECVPATEDHCPPGSAWDPAEGACMIDCTGGTIAGVACSYTGTSTATLPGAGYSNAASVTFRADRFEGCLIVYEPVAGSVETTYPAEGCTYEPKTRDVTVATTSCVFKIMSGPQPYLIADCGTYWDGMLLCPPDVSAPTTLGGLWLYTTREDVQADQSLSGTFNVAGYDVSFSFTPN